MQSEPSHNLSGIHPDELNALESVREITDFLQIQANFSGFHNLSFFRNLRIIHGRVLDRLLPLLFCFFISVAMYKLQIHFNNNNDYYYY